jgi:hypothetical protein
MSIPVGQWGLSYRSNHIGHNEADQEDVADDEEKAEKSDHVRRKPHGQKLDEGIPLIPSQNQSVIALLGICDTRYALCDSHEEFGKSYVVSQNVVGNERLVHAGILVRLQGHKSLIGKSFLGLCKRGRKNGTRLVHGPFANEIPGHSSVTHLGPF